MKKIKLQSGNLFKKFEEDRIEGLGTIFGGSSTEQTTDVSTSDADCTDNGGQCADATPWDQDSDDTSDSTQRHLDDGGSGY